MKIERDGDTIRYQDEQEEGNSIIGGVIAPLVAVQTVDEEGLNQYWDYCANIIKPSGHSVQEAIEWLEGNWDLEPLPFDNRHMVIQRANIAMNRFPEQYRNPDISPEMTDEEIERRIKEGHARHQAAQETTDGQLGIRLRGYHIPYTLRNQPLYDEGYAEFEQHMAEQRRWMQENHPDHIPPPIMEQEKRKADAYLFIEEIEGQISSNGVGGGPLCRKLGKYIGISIEDIETRSHRFMGYVHHMAEEGELPTLQEFCASDFPYK